MNHRTRIDVNNLEEMRRNFSYDPATGILLRKRFAHGKEWWREVNAKHNPNLDNTWYVCTVGRRPLYVHRICWFLTYGYWPVQIDHKNHIKNDNRLCNLREAKNGENSQNRLPFKMDSKTSKYKGIGWNQGAKKWIARINVTKEGKGRRIYLGVFNDENEAALAYNEAAKRYYGEFAWLNTVE